MNSLHWLTWVLTNAWTIRSYDRRKITLAAYLEMSGAIKTGSGNRSRLLRDSMQPFSTKKLRKMAHTKTRDLVQASQLCDCVKPWTWMGEWDQWHELSSHICFMLLCFSSVLYWISVFILRRNFDCKHLILGTSAIIGNPIRKKCLSPHSFIGIVLLKSVRW